MRKAYFLLLFALQFSVVGSAQQVVKQNGKFGIADFDGEIRIEFIYDSIFYFSSTSNYGFEYQCYVTQNNSFDDIRYGLVFTKGKRENKKTFINIEPRFENVYKNESFEFFTIKNGLVAKTVLCNSEIDTLSPFIHFHGEGIVSTDHIFDSVYYYKENNKVLHGFKSFVYKNGQLGYLKGVNHYLPPIYDDIRVFEPSKLNRITKNGYLIEDDNRSHYIIYFVKKNDTLELFYGIKNGIINSHVTEMPYTNIDDYKRFITNQNEFMLVSNKAEKPIVYYTLSDTLPKILKDMQGKPIVLKEKYHNIHMVDKPYYKDQFHSMVYFDSITKTYKSQDIEWILGYRDKDSYLYKNRFYAHYQVLVLKIRNSDRCIVFQGATNNTVFRTEKFEKRTEYNNVYFLNGEVYELPRSLELSLARDSVFKLSNVTYMRNRRMDYYYIRRSHFQYIVKRYDLINGDEDVQISIIDPSKPKTILSHTRALKTYSNNLFKYELKYTCDSSFIVCNYQYTDNNKGKVRVHTLGYINDKGNSFSNIGGLKSAKFAIYDNKMFNKSLSYWKNNDKIATIGFNKMYGYSSSDTLLFNSFELGFGLGEDDKQIWDTEFFGKCGGHWSHHMIPYASLEYRFISSEEEGNIDKVSPIMLNLGASMGGGIALLIIPISFNLYAGIGTDFNYTYLKGGTGFDLYYLTVGVGSMFRIGTSNTPEKYLKAPGYIYIRFNIFPN